MSPCYKKLIKISSTSQVVYLGLGEPPLSLIGELIEALVNSTSDETGRKLVNHKSLISLELPI